MREEKERLAREWLTKLKPTLGLDERKKLTTNDEGKENDGTRRQGNTAATRGVVGDARRRSASPKSAYAVRGKYADVSDDDNDDEDASDAKKVEKETAGTRFRKAFVSEAIHLVDIWFAGENGDERQAEELERVKNTLRKVRSDPPIAPDEPVPITLRPFDVAPGRSDKDLKFVYKHALTTVHDVKRQMAKRFELPVEALDLVLGGKKLSDEKTLLECAVCAGFIVYLRVDYAVANHIMTTTLDINPGQRTPITRLTMKEVGKWVAE